MEKIVFECELVTPMFIYGEDGKTPELRPASIKGIMRFWWRAIHGNLTLDELRKKESEIFGSTDKKSSFSIKLQYNGMDTERTKPLPHKVFKKMAFKKNDKFKICFKITENKDLVVNLFKLSILLGGFGQRSRRGFGSLKIIGEKTITSEEMITNLIKTINKNFKYNNEKQTKEEKYPFIKNIEIGRDYSSVEELLKIISEATHNHNHNELGFAIGEKRLASPVYVSVIKENGNFYKPIITTFEVSDTKYLKKEEEIDQIQNNFKKDIL